MNMHLDPLYNNTPFKTAGDLIRKFKSLPEDSIEVIPLSKQILNELNKIPVGNEQNISELLLSLIESKAHRAHDINKRSVLEAYKKLESIGLVCCIVEHLEIISYAASYTTLKLILASKRTTYNEGCDCAL